MVARIPASCPVGGSAMSPLITESRWWTNAAKNTPTSGPCPP